MEQNFYPNFTSFLAFQINQQREAPFNSLGDTSVELDLYGLLSTYE